MTTRSYGGQNRLAGGVLYWSADNVFYTTMKSIKNRTPDVSMLLFMLFIVSAGLPQNLADMAAERGILIGAAVKPELLDNRGYAQTLTRHFSILTPENHMKPGYVQPAQGNYSFFEADKIVAFALEHGMKIRGHTLVWHEQNPGWLESGALSRNELLAAMKDHITTVAGHYRGRIFSWDVVNEAFDAGRFRQSFWYKTVGAGYIDSAFTWASLADTRARLILNDFDVEEICPKSDLMYTTVARMKTNGIPIHGVGFQCHLNIDKPPDFTSIYANMKRFAELGVDIELTEIDIRLVDPVTPARLELQAVLFKKIVELALHFPCCKVLTTWGVSDEHFEISFVDVKYGNGLLFTRNYQKKPAYDSLYAALKRGPVALDYEASLEKQAALKGRYLIPPFRAVHINTPPVVDGRVRRNEWKGACTYGFLYNQLDSLDTRMPDNRGDISGWWKTAYNGNRLFGAIHRRDDRIITGNPAPECNDNVEIFIAVDSLFSSYRAVAGKGWDQKPADTSAPQAAWSSNRRDFEFSLVLPLDSLPGAIVGWNIAITDNDGNAPSSPAYRVFSINGSDRSRHRDELGELFLDASFPPSMDNRYITPSFKANPCSIAPVIDGIEGVNEWAGAVIYGFGYNQLSRHDKRPPANKNDCSGEWRILYAGATLYGLVHRRDNWTIRVLAETYKNDNVEIFIKTGDEFFQFRSIAGSDWEPHISAWPRRAVWNKKATVLEFMIQLPLDTCAGRTIGWNIALSDNDVGGERKYQLYPVNGDNECWRNRDFAELFFNLPGK